MRRDQNIKFYKVQPPPTPPPYPWGGSCSSAAPCARGSCRTSSGRSRQVLRISRNHQLCKNSHTQNALITVLPRLAVANRSKLVSFHLADGEGAGHIQHPPWVAAPGAYKWSGRRGRRGSLWRERKPLSYEGRLGGRTMDGGKKKVLSRGEY